MNGFMKVMLLVFVVLYGLSPVDACPGPIDDILLIALAFASQMRAGVPKE